MAGIDGALYGGVTSNMGVTPDELPGSGHGITPPEELQTADVSQLDLGTVNQQGAAVRASAKMELPGRLVSLVAAAKAWDTTAVIQSLGKPEFTPDDGPGVPTAQQQLAQFPFELSKSQERRFFQSRSSQERQWYIDQWTDQHRDQQIAGEHPLQSLLVGVVDPVYLGIGLSTNLLAKGTRVAGKALATPKIAPTKAALLQRTAPTAAAEELTKGVAKAITIAGNVGASAAVLGAVDEVRPVSSAEYGLNVLAHLAGSAYVANVLNKTDVWPGARAIGSLTDTVVPPALRPGASATAGEVAAGVDEALTASTKSWGQRFGETVAWNIHKTFGKTSSAGKRIADELFDDNMDLTKTSVESVKAGIRNDLGMYQKHYEDGVRELLAQRGFGTWRQLWSNRASRAAQAEIDDAVKNELLDMNQAFRQGRPHVSSAAPEIQQLAKRYDTMMKQAAKEAGLDYVPGYFSRRWDGMRMEAAIEAITKTGKTVEQAHRTMSKFVADSMLKANPDWDVQLAKDVGSAIVSRAVDKAKRLDYKAGGGFDMATVAQVRALLDGVPEERIQKVAKVLLGQIDEKGGAPWLKSRVNIDHTTSMTIGDRTMRISDFIDGNLTKNTERYLDNVSATIAMQRKGINGTSDLMKVRQEFIMGAKDRAAAERLFDSSVNFLMGNPVGNDVSQFWRNVSMYNRMITLGSSGLWQATEYHKMMQQYGMVKTLGAALKEMPVFRRLWTDMSKDKNVARDLKHVLSEWSENTVRMRPFIQRFEDNFEIPENAALTSTLSHGQQLIPYVNGMKYIHGHQARMHANLLYDRVQAAASGDKAAVKMLEKYGVSSPIIGQLRTQLAKHGDNVDMWSSEVWRGLRPALNKMADEAVLRQRMGDLPAWMLMSDVGKFVGTYRSFIFTSHNKILAGTAARDGLAATSLMMLYQFPLAMAATAAAAELSGKPIKDENDLASKAIGQMGSLGLVADLWGTITDKGSLGAAGLIPFDRGIRAIKSTGNAIAGTGTPEKAIEDGAKMLPIIGIVPGYKALTKLED